MKKIPDKGNGLRRFVSWQVGVLIVMALIVATSLWFVADSALLAQSSSDRLTTDESLTKDGVTVEISESVKTTAGLDIGHTFRTANSDMVVHPIGVPEIRSGETVVRARKGVVGGSGNFTTSIPWDITKTGHTEVADLNLGSFVLSKPDIAGSAQIKLGENYASAIATSRQSVSVSLNTDLMMDGRRYRVTEMTIFGDGGSTNFSRFTLTLSPVNVSADKTEIASGGDSNVTLADDLGNSYQWLGTRTRWKKAPNSRAVAWQQLSFAGVPPISASTLALSVTGGGEVVGPFVFEDVRLVQGDGS